MTAVMFYQIKSLAGKDNDYNFENVLTIETIDILELANFTSQKNTFSWNCKFKSSLDISVCIPSIIFSNCTSCLNQERALVQGHSGLL